MAALENCWCSKCRQSRVDVGGTRGGNSRTAERSGLFLREVKNAIAIL